MPRRPSPARAPLKRWTLVKLLLSLLAGAVVTWVVAATAMTVGHFGRESQEIFGFTWPSGHRGRSTHVTSIFLETWGTYSRASPTREVPPRVDVVGTLPGWAEVTGHELPLEVPYSLAAGIIEPAFTMRISIYNGSTTSDRVASGGWMLSAAGEPVYLPFRILPLGFTLNTLLAAGVLLGLSEGFAFARRRVRRAKGRCPACGYDRAGITMDVACPECGGV
jgi:hypothetical protein